VHIATGYAFYMGSIKNGKENEFATEIVLILKDVVISGTVLTFKLHSIFS
jgi:hypothetical protein